MVGAVVPWPHDWIVLMIINLVMSWSVARLVAGPYRQSKYNTRP
jgi:hypothetical protein